MTGILPLVALLWVVILLPPEVRIEVAGLQLYSYRLVLIPGLLVVLMRLVDGSLRLVFADLCILIAGIWPIVALTQLYGMTDGGVPAVAGFIDSTGSYFLARACIRSELDLRRLVVLIIPALVVAAVLMMLESVGHRIFVRPFFASIFGSVYDYSNEGGPIELFFREEVRLGLMRAYGTFGHPILGGLLLSSSLPLIWLARIKTGPKIAGALAALAGFFGVSSAAIVGVILAVGLLVVDFVLRFFRNLNWWIVSTLLFVPLVIAQFGTQSGVINLLSRATLNPATAFTRQEIWRYGLRSVQNHPWFGIGREAYERPENLTASIDAHFLAQGVSTGMITPIATMIGMLFLIFALGRRASRVPDRNSRSLAMGMNFTLILLFFGAFTVTYFSDVRIWFMAMFGIAGSLVALGKLEAPASPQGIPQAPAGLGRQAGHAGT